MANQIIQPRHTRFVDGMGQFGIILPPIRYDEDINGARVVILKIRPHDEMKVFYNIRDQHLDPVTQTINKTYFAEDVLFLDQNPSTGFILILKSFDGKPTQLSDKGVNLRERIKNFQIENKSLRRTIARMQYDMERMMSNPQEFWIKWSGTLKEVIKNVRGREILMQTTEEDNGEGSGSR